MDELWHRISTNILVDFEFKKTYWIPKIYNQREKAEEFLNILLSFPVKSKVYVVGGKEVKPCVFLNLKIIFKAVLLILK